MIIITRRRVWTAAAFTYAIVAMLGLGALTSKLRAQTASQNNLSLTLQQLDLSGVPILNRALPKFSYDGVTGVFTNGILLDTSAHSQTLPSTQVLQFYFKNTHATAIITITWTPTTGSTATVIRVGPGGTLAFWSTTSTSTVGISALSLTSNTINATYEMFLGS